MKKRLPPNNELSPQPACENCVHMIKNKHEQEMIVCVQHLKTMPANNSLVCELHSMRNKKTGISG